MEEQWKDFEGGKLVLVLSCSVELGSMFKEPDFNIQEFSRWGPSMGLKGSRLGVVTRWPEKSKA